MGQQVEELKATIAQLKASQAQMTRELAKASEAKTTETRPAEQNLRPRVSALTPPPAAGRRRRPCASRSRPIPIRLLRARAGCRRSRSAASAGAGRRTVAAAPPANNRRRRRAGGAPADAVAVARPAVRRSRNRLSDRAFARPAIARCSTAGFGSTPELSSGAVPASSSWRLRYDATPWLPRHRPCSRKLRIVGGLRDRGEAVLLHHLACNRVDLHFRHHVALPSTSPDRFTLRLPIKARSRVPSAIFTS